MKKFERLHTNILGIEMNAPVLTASGTFGFGEEFADFVDLSLLGGVMVKGTTLKPRRGNEGVRITEIDPAYVDEVREKLPLMSARRTDIYDLCYNDRTDQEV